METSHKHSVVGCLIWLLATLPLHVFSQAITMNSGDVNIVDLTTWADDGFELGFDADQCGIANPQFVPGFLGHQHAFLCEVDSRQSQLPPSDGYLTSANNTLFCSVNGSGSSTMTVVWNNYSQSYHFSPVLGTYLAFGSSDYDFDLNLEVTNVAPGTPVNVYFYYEVYTAAFSRSEVGEPDAASTTGTLTLGGTELFADAGFNMSFTSTPTTSGGANKVQKSGVMNVLAGTPFNLEIANTAFNTITDPGYDVRVNMWKDRSTMNYLGIMILSVAPIVYPGPDVPTPPDASYFSVDIGSANELSSVSPVAQYRFDPGDAYLIQGPLVPQGGRDGEIDDGAFMGSDIPPFAPDLPLPPSSAAPIGSGLGVIPTTLSYLNINGIALADFFVTPQGPFQYVPSSACVKPLKYLYISYSDSDLESYTSVMPSVASNSNSSLANAVYGSSANKDEVIEMEYLLYPTSIYHRGGVMAENDVHGNLGPNPIFHPDPLTANANDDDVNALTFTRNLSVCPHFYFTVDHAARGVFADGNIPLPSTIYRYDPNLIAPVPAVQAPDIGIMPDTDINAFDFVQFTNPGVPGQVGVLAMIFSVDTDDPLTPEDESGQLDPTKLYYSLLNGTHDELDAFFFADDNIDAIANWDASIVPPITNSCHPSNFTAPPTGLQVSVSGNTTTVSWNPYPGSTICEVRANVVTAAGDQQFLVGSITGTTPPTSKSFPSNSLQPNTTYRVRVRCACGIAGTVNVSPYTQYIFYTTPGSVPDEATLVIEPIAEPILQLYPNPAARSFTLQATFAMDGPATITISNIMGQQLKELRMEVHDGRLVQEIDVNDLSPGVYIVGFKSGEIWQTRKVVIQR